MNSISSPIQYKIDDMPVAKHEKSPVAAIYSKIESLLPYKSGYSVAQLEADNFYLQTKRSLFKFARTRLLNEILICNVSIIQQINDHDKDAPLKDRNTASLKSLAVILDLLQSLLNEVWDEVEGGSAEINIYKDMGLTFPQSSMNGKKYRVIQPQSIPTRIYRKLLSVLSELKTDSDLIKLSHDPNITRQEILVKRVTTDPPPEKSHFMNLIDKHIASISKFLSAAEPQEFFNFIEFKLKSSTDSQALPCTDFIAITYLTSDVIPKYIDLAKRITQVTGRHLHQNSFVYCLSDAIYEWALCRTKDYLKATEDIKFSNEVDNFFDLALRLAEPKPPKPTYKWLSSLLLLIPKYFEKFMKEKNSRTSTLALKRLGGSKTSPKQKFISDLVTVIQKIPVAGESLMRVIMIGASVQVINPDHCLAKFANELFIQCKQDLLIDNLNYFPHNADFNTTTELRSFYFSIACVLETDKMNKYCCSVFGNVNTPAAHLIPLSGGIRDVIGVPSLSKYLFNLIYDISPDMKGVLHRLSHNFTGGMFETDSDSTISQGSNNQMMDMMDVLQHSTTNPLAPIPTASTVTSNHSITSSSSAGRGSFTRSVTLPDPSSKSTGTKAKAKFLSAKVKNVKNSLNRHSTSSPTATTPSSTVSTDSYNSISNSNNSNINIDTSTRPLSRSSARSPMQVSPVQSNSPSDELPSSTSQPGMYVKRSSDPRKSEKAVLINLLCSYRVYPFLCYCDHGKLDYANPDFMEFTEDYKKFIQPIIYLISVDDKDLSLASEEFLLSFPVLLSNTDPGRVAVAYIGSAIMNDLLCKLILSIDNTSEKDHLIKLLVRYTELRSQYADMSFMTYFSNNKFHACGLCSLLVRNYERAVFLGLFSDKVDTLRMSRQLLENYVTTVEAPSHLPTCFEKYNLSLTKSILEDKVPAGTMATRKKLRDRLCALTEPTSALLDVWLLMYDKLSTAHNYKQIASNMYDFDPDSVSEEQIDNYGEYFASLGGVILSPEFANDPRKPEFLEKLTLFLNYNLVNIFSNNSKRRDRSREVLCVSLHPFLCGLLLDLVSKQLGRFEKALNMGNYQVCELFINLLRNITQIEYESLFFYAVDLWNINFKILQALNIDSQNPAFLRLKLKFCKLQVLFLSEIEELSMHGNILKKNEYARVVSEYLEFSFTYDSESNSNSNSSSNSNTIPTSTTISATNNNSNGKNESSETLSSKPKTDVFKRELDDLHFDIKAESSMMLKIILFKLPLDTPYHNVTHTKEEKLATSVVFSNYFTLFVRILEKLNAISNGDNQNLTMQHRSSTIVKNIIQSLTNLLDANPEVGLKYSLPLGYHEDALIRVSFIKVFAKLVESINRKTKVSEEEQRLGHYHSFMNVFANNPGLMLAATSACPTTDVDSFANALLTMTEDKNKELSVLLMLLKADILSTTDSVEILRSNTVATRMVALYSNSEALDYLIQVFRPVLSEMIEKEEFFDLHHSADRSSTDNDKDLSLFMKYLNKIIDAICSSVNSMPFGLRAISKTIFSTAAINFPESKFAALGAFLFLRLYNPAIVSPERTGIVSLQSFPFKKSLLQVARVLQTMANESVATGKSLLLESKLVELEELKIKINKFMLEVINIETVPEASELVVSFEVDEQIRNYNTGYAYFHAFFYDNWLKIRQIFSQPSSLYALGLDEKFLLIREQDDNLAAMGLPTRVKGYEIPESIRNDKSERGVLLYDFMSQISLKDQDCRQVVSESITKDGTPLVIVSFSDFGVGMSHEILIYQIFQVSSKYWDAPYAIFIDCTGFRDENVFIQTLIQSEQLAPPEYLGFLKRTYYYNLSPVLWNVIRQHKQYSHEMQEGKHREVIFLNSNDDSKTIARSGLININNPLIKDSRVTFHDVSLYQEQLKRFIPVKLKVGNKYLQIYISQPQRLKIYGKMKMVSLMDSFRVEDLDELSSSTFTGVSNEISMVDSRSNTRLIFVSPKKIEILRTLYFSRARNTDASGELDENYEEIALQTFIGQLLNITLTGLLSTEDDIRNSSYALLASLSEMLDIPDKKIEHVDGIAFPYGSFDYIFAFSGDLARDFPSGTYDFLRGFFIALDHVDPADRGSVIMYASPWIKNIFNYVFLADSVNGARKARELVKKFVRASRNSKATSRPFSLYIWSKLSLDDRLVDIILDEIVAAAIDHEAEGHDWEEITRYWPMTPTVEVCATLVRKLRERSFKIPFDETEIEQHTRWIETSILARFLSYLVFDSVLFVEKHISDIFYLISIYMDDGPLDFRNCLLKLLIRTFHTFLSKDTLTLRQRSYIKNKIELFNGARFRLLFGLTRNDTLKPQDLLGADMVSKSNDVGTVTEILTEFLEICSPDWELHSIKWNSYCLSIAFNRNSKLQGRALTVLGTLSMKGVNNRLVYKFLEFVIQMYDEYDHGVHDLRYMSTCVRGFHALSKMCEGLPEDSPFVTHFFGYACSLTLLDHLTFYRYGVTTLVATLNKISDYLEDKDIPLIDYVFQSKAIFGELLDEYQSIVGLRMTKENFDITILILLARGIEVPYTRQICYDSMKSILKIRYKEAIKFLRTKNEPFNTNIGCYLFFIYASVSSDGDLVSTLRECGLTNLEYVKTKSKISVPKILIDFFNNSNADHLACCYVICKFFASQKANDQAAARVLVLFSEIHANNKELAWSFYSLLAAPMNEILENGSSPQLLHIVLDLVTESALATQFKSKDQLQTSMLNKLQEAKMDGVLTYDFSNTRDSVGFTAQKNQLSANSATKLGYLKLILQRIQSTYIEDDL